MTRSRMEVRLWQQATAINRLPEYVSRISNASRSILVQFDHDFLYCGLRCSKTMGIVRAQSQTEDTKIHRTIIWAILRPGESRR